MGRIFPWDTSNNSMCFSMGRFNNFPIALFETAISKKVFKKLMDKETLIKLAQPAATLILALSIFSIPLLSNAELYEGDTLKVKITNAYAFN